jgi:DNA-binding NarL/FixJ family response regulator
MPHLQKADDLRRIALLRMLDLAGVDPDPALDRLTRVPVTAVGIVRVAPAAFDVVVTDLNMPERSGLDVARALQRIRADLPVIISSGNIPDRLQDEARQAGVRGLVHKQFTLEALGAVIHWVLAGGQRLGLEPLQMSSR